MKEKPMTLEVQELLNVLVEKLNDSKLPIFNKKIILTELFNQLTIAEQKELEEFNKSLEGNNDETKK